MRDYQRNEATSTAPTDGIDRERKTPSLLGNKIRHHPIATFALGAI